MVDKSRVTRRSALCFIGSGTIVAASGGFETFGFSNITATRDATVKTVDDSDALLGLFVPDSIDRKGRSLLVEITNNLTADIEGTVSLVEGGGTLYDPSGTPGDPASFSLTAATESSTDSAIIELDPENYEGPIRFEIAAATPDSTFSFEAVRETESTKNAQTSGVAITDLHNFKARKNGNYWEIQRVSVESDEFELDRVEYEITNEANTVVGERVDGATGTTYDRTDLRIDPNDGEDVVKKTEYTLTVRAYDVDGNYDIATATDVA